MGKAAKTSRGNSGNRSGFIAAAAPLFVMAAICAFGIFPFAFLWWYLGASVLSFVVYAHDKSAAIAGKRRTPEKTLHLLSLIGGWPGALYAQKSLRHKSSKTSFQKVYWMTVVLNIAGLAFLVSDYGRGFLAVVGAWVG